MRKCLRCNNEMHDGLELKVEGAAYGIKVSKPGIFKESLGKVKCAVCPICGDIETYLENTEKISTLNNK